MAKETDKKKTAAKAADKKPAKAAEKKTTAMKADDKKAAKAAEKKATTKAAEKKVAEKKPAAKKADTSKLDALIKAAVADGKITDDEHKMLEKCAKEEGVDKDELKKMLEAKLQSKKKEGGKEEKKGGFLGSLFKIYAAIYADIHSNIPSDINTDIHTDKGSEKKSEETKEPQESKDPQDPFSGLMVTVEGGMFTQKWICSWEEHPGGDMRRKIVTRKEIRYRNVRVSTFKICKYPVTQAQWKSIMGIFKNPSHFKGGDRPVDNVSWDDAQEFIKKLNAKTGKHYALPTEAQWEFAARGGNKSKNYEYAGCNESDLDAYAWYSKNSSESTHTVGEKNPNELDLYDMTGNVWEWCEDWYQEEYPSGDISDPKGPSAGQYRVMRGGSWRNWADYCRVANRGRNVPSNRDKDTGFRLVLLP